jgi:hypothetical protein
MNPITWPIMSLSLPIPILLVALLLLDKLDSETMALNKCLHLREVEAGVDKQLY